MIIPTSLYIHIPWCIKKCPYCDFNSHAIKDNNFPDMNNEKVYIHYLIQDLQQTIKDYQLDNNPRAIHSIFFGGGTPSLFNADSIGLILEKVKENLTLSPQCEITLEANPGTFEQAKFSGYKQAGINRLSIGIQSFSEAHLTKLGRVHNHTEALKAVEIARKAGFDNLNLDIMYGLVEQTLDQAMADLHTAISLEPEHLSWYHLTLEPNTLFHQFPPKLPEESIIDIIEEQGRNLLFDNDYSRYEISAYSKQNKKSQHNLNYWTFGDYIGIGAGAHSKLSVQTENGFIIQRLQKHKNPKIYQDPENIDNIKQNFIAETKIIPSTEIALEYMLNALRLTQGISLDNFNLYTGLSLETIQAPIAKAIQLNLLSYNKLNNTIQPTERGLRYLNNLVGLFIPK